MKVPKKSRVVLAISTIACVVVIVLFLQLRTSEPSFKNTIILGKKVFKLEVADSDAERVRGLSGREGLAKGSAMLFVFPEAGRQCMWMQGMNFSLDMVWLDSSKQVIKVMENVSPLTYPRNFCADNAKYVLEFNTGVTKESNLKVGQNLNF